MKKANCAHDLNMTRTRHGKEEEEEEEHNSRLSYYDTSSMEQVEDHGVKDAMILSVTVRNIFHRCCRHPRLLHLLIE